MSLDNPKSSRVVSLSSCVMNTFNDEDRYNMAEYNRRYQFAIRGVKQLFMYHLPIAETATFIVPDSGVIQLPGDYIDYYRIGYKVNGQIRTLTLNNNLLLPRTDNCGLTQAESPYNDMDSGNIQAYGITGGINAGYFRIDKEFNTLNVMKLAVGTEVVVEYKSTGVGRNTLIPVAAEESIISWIHWKRKQHSSQFDKWEKVQAENDYDNDVALMRSQVYAFTIDDFNDVLYETNGQLIRR